MMRVSHLVLCSMVFTLLCPLSGQTGVLKLTQKKLNFKYISSLCLFPTFLDRFRGGLC